MLHYIHQLLHPSVFITDASAGNEFDESRVCGPEVQNYELKGARILCRTAELNDHSWWVYHYKQPL